MLATMALFLSPAVLIPLHGIVQLGSNLGRSALMYKHIIKGILPAFILGAVIGTIAGGQMLIAIPSDTLKGILGVFIIYAVWAPKFKARNPSHKTFFGVGVFSSIITMFIGATGPFVSPFVVAASDEHTQTVATHGALMSIQHLLKLLVFGALGFTFTPYIPLLIGLIVMGFIGSLIGKHTLRLLPERVFKNGLKAVLTIIAIRLLFGAISTLWAA